MPWRVSFNARDEMAHRPLDANQVSFVEGLPSGHANGWSRLAQEATRGFIQLLSRSVKLAGARNGEKFSRAIMDVPCARLR
jgi:hypothetical protein